MVSDKEHVWHSSFHITDKKQRRCKCFYFIFLDYKLDVQINFLLFSLNLKSHFRLKYLSILFGFLISTLPKLAKRVI